MDLKRSRRPPQGEDGPQAGRAPRARPAAAGCLYFLGVFAAGFVLGVLRLSILTPAMGPFLAVALELPVMLAVSWFACGWLALRFSVSRAADAVVMGAVAFSLLIAAEIGLAVALGGSSVQGALASWGTPAGALGLAGQIAFGLFPLLRRVSA